MRVSLPFGLLALVGVLTVVDAAVMTFDFDFNELKMEILTEGPMYSTADSPFSAPGRKSSIRLDFDWWMQAHADRHRIAVVFTTSSAMTRSGGLPKELLACTADFKNDQYESHIYSEPDGPFMRQITVESEVEHTTVGDDFPRVLLFVCPCLPDQPGLPLGLAKRCWTGDTVAGDQGARLVGQVRFSNAYGMLSATDFPLLPFYAALTVSYFVLLVVFVGASFYYRNNLNLLHYATALLAAMGMVECALFFVLYLWKNFTGSTSWPPTPLQWAAAIFGVGKRALGRVLLLAVGLGYGTIKPKIPCPTATLMLFLTVAYVGLSIWKDVAEDVLFIRNPDEAEALLNTTEGAILCVDLVVLMWTLFALVQTQQTLDANRQTAKLKMYNALIAVMLCFVVIWGVFEAYRVAVTKKLVALDWQLVWILHSFWHVAGFAILVTIAIVWRPSPTSQDLSYWHQIEQVDFDESEGEDEDVEGAVEFEDIELDPTL